MSPNDRVDEIQSRLDADSPGPIEAHCRSDLGFLLEERTRLLELVDDMTKILWAMQEGFGEIFALLDGVLKQVEEERG